jgi:hypothetical protein
LVAQNVYYAITIVFDAVDQGTQGIGPDLPTFMLSCALVDVARNKVI